MSNDIKKCEQWAALKLGDVCEIIGGKNQAAVLNPNGKYPIYGSSGIFGYANDYICEAGTTIIGRKGTINNPIYVSTKFWNVDTAFGLTPKKDINGKFLYYFCRGFNFHALDKSTTIPSLAKRDLLAIDIKIPPLETQHLIVSKIESLFSELDKGIESLKTAQQQLKVYRQSVLKWAFEGKLTNDDVKDGELPKGWKWVKLQEIASDISDGDHQAPPKSETGIPFITISNINKITSKIDFNDTFKVEIDYFRNLKPNRKPQKGDVLYTVTGSFGIPILIDFEDDFCFQRHIGLVRPLNEVNQKWVYYLLQTPQVYNQAKITATGTAQKTVALSSLRNFKIPFCLNDEQKSLVSEIESRLSVCDKIEETINQSLQQSEALRQSILKKAFEGRLI